MCLRNQCYFSDFQKAIYSGKKILLWYYIHQENTSLHFIVCGALRRHVLINKTSFSCYSRKYSRSQKMKKTFHSFYISIITVKYQSLTLKRLKQEGKQWINSICKYRCETQKYSKYQQIKFRSELQNKSCLTRQNLLHDCKNDSVCLANSFYKHIKETCNYSNRFKVTFE